MMTKASLLRIFLTWTYILAAGVTIAAGLPEPDKITKEELLPLLGKQDLTILDLRLPREWDASNIKIKGAVREDPYKPGQWLEKYPKDTMLVMYCD